MIAHVGVAATYNTSMLFGLIATACLPASAMNFNQSHDPSDALGEEPRLVSGVLSQSVIYSKIVQHRLLLPFDTQNTELIRLVPISVTLLCCSKPVMIVELSMTLHRAFSK